MAQSPDTIRVDRWLWFARFFKTRGLATRLVAGGHLRINGEKVAKAAAAVAPGDTLTFAQGNRIRVVRVVDTGLRRGPASEARLLYDDLTPEAPPPPDAPRPRSGGRPTKKDRRNMNAARRDPLE